VAPPPVEWKTVFAIELPLRRTCPAVLLIARFALAVSRSEP
jgi:hypothetical protein